MKISIISTILLLLSNFTFAQSNLDSDLSTFNKVVVEGNIELTLSESDNNSFTAELVGVSSERFQWSIENGEVTFKLKKSIKVGKESNKVEKAIIKLSYKTISDIKVAGGGKVLAENVIESDVISLDINNKSSISIEVEARDVRINAFNAIATVAGNSEFLTVKSTSNGSINCSNLSSKIVNAHTTTNGECYIWVTQKLDAKANSNSNVFYKGEPELTNFSTSTLGNIQKF